MRFSKWSIPRSMISPCDKTYFSTLLTGNFENIRIPTSITASVPCSAYEKFHVFIDVVVASIDREIDHFCSFAPGPEIAFYFYWGVNKWICLPRRGKKCTLWPPNRINQFCYYILTCHRTFVNLNIMIPNFTSKSFLNIFENLRNAYMENFKRVTNFFKELEIFY